MCPFAALRIRLRAMGALTHPFTERTRARLHDLSWRLLLRQLIRKKVRDASCACCRAMHVE